MMYSMNIIISSEKVKHMIYLSIVLCVVQLFDLLSPLGSLWVGQNILVKFRRTKQNFL